ncbi:type I DNA topoisomerase [Candidatus Margulisiibacteriota bacterium]
MSKNLVIVESPAKAKTLKKFLGKDFDVKACGGHIRDLPPKTLGVDLKNNFEPKYQTIKGKTKILKPLKIAAKKAEVVFLAPDPDREGEAIAWHLSHIFKGANMKRIEFHEITKKAVQDAVKNPRDIDMKRVDAQQARRILDRLVGYKLSPLLWKKIRKGLSAGRVQSVAVELICEREKLIKAFNAVEYWSVTASLAPDGDEEKFTAKLFQKAGEKVQIGSKEEVDIILAELDGKTYSIPKIVRKEQNRHPSPPFITSTLQQEASRKLGYSAKKTMVIAQQLYEGVEVKDEGSVGLITYMRTDSVRIAKEAQDEVNDMVKQDFGPSYIPSEPRVYKTKKQAQDAHEAIRPTSVLRKPDAIKDDLSSDQFKVYQLIWNRFVSSQMSSAVLDKTQVDISAGDYTFRANGSVVKFDGFMRIYLESEDVEEEKEGILPPLSEGQALRLLSIDPKQHFTEPPPRYTEASLIKELEQKGIGRPSTYAPIMSTVVDRGYVIRDGKRLTPTELGILITDQLLKHFPVIMDYEFTARMENDLDRILEGEIDWVSVVKEFYVPFEERLQKAHVEMEKLKKEIMTKEKCEKCGKPMLIRSGRYGDFMACSGYPECKTTKPLPSEDGKKIEEKCEKCGKPMVEKRSRFGSFLACSGYPDCKNIKSILKPIGIKCPECGGDIVQRKTKRGKIFFGCGNYPKCNFAAWDKPLEEKCPKCGGLLVEKKTKKHTSKKCLNKECDFEEKQENV